MQAPVRERPIRIFKQEELIDFVQKEFGETAVVGPFIGICSCLLITEKSSFIINSRLFIREITSTGYLENNNAKEIENALKEAYFNQTRGVDQNVQ
ncbi:MAG: hypothetical protein WCG91_01155 [Candidatus Shapirobacteria bacterium]